MKCNETFETREQLMNHRIECSFKYKNSRMHVVIALLNIVDDAQLDGMLINQMQIRRLKEDSHTVRRIDENALTSDHAINRRVTLFTIRDHERLFAVHNLPKNRRRRTSSTGSIDTAFVHGYFGAKVTQRGLEKFRSECLARGITVVPNLVPMVARQIGEVAQMAAIMDTQGRIASNSPTSQRCPMACFTPDGIRHFLGLYEAHHAPLVSSCHGLVLSVDGDIHTTKSSLYWASETFTASNPVL